MTKCQGLIASGRRCSRPVKPGESFCWQHQPNVSEPDLQERNATSERSEDSEEYRRDLIGRSVRDAFEIIIAITTLRYEMAARMLVDRWLELFRIWPRSVLAATIIFPVVWIAGTVIIIDQVEKRQEATRLQSASYSEQAERLRQTQQSLRALLQFVEDQQRTIEEKQDLIGSLKKQQEDLEGLVKADRATVDRLFEEQERRFNNSLWTERIVSFFSGMLASLLATIIWHALGKRNQLHGGTA